jgi:hypothetical protein
MTERPPNQTDKNSNTKSTFEQFLKSRDIHGISAFTKHSVDVLKALDGILGPCAENEVCDYCQQSVHDRETFWVDSGKYMITKSCLSCIVKAFRKWSKAPEPEEVTTEEVWKYLSARVHGKAAR